MMLGRRRSLGAIAGSGFPAAGPTPAPPSLSKSKKKKLSKKDRECLRRLRSNSDLFCMMNGRGGDMSPPEGSPSRSRSRPGSPVLAKASPGSKSAAQPSLSSDGNIDLNSAVNKKRLQLMELRFEEERLRRAKEQHQLDINDYKALKRVQKAKGTSVKFVATEDDIEVCELLSISSIKSNEVYACNVGGFRLALKKLASSRANSRDIRAFYNEISIMSNLPGNKALVRYAFHMLYQGEMCLFMELRSGTLREHLDSLLLAKSSLSPITAVQVALQVAQGLSCLHANKVIHRDVKAENVFVNFGPDGNVSSCVLGDYDVSVLVGDNVTPPSQAIGTPEFMAPEALNASPYGQAVDVYSYGCFVYELITLNVPWRGVAGFEEKVLAGKKPELQHITKLVYPTLCNIFLLCTAPATTKRPSMQEVVVILQGALANLVQHSSKPRTPVLDLQPPASSSRGNSPVTRPDRSRSVSHY